MQQLARKRVDAEDFATAAELAQLSGESYDTIDHWCDKGLLKFERKGRTRRLSKSENLKRCKLIRKLQNEGLNLVAIERTVSSRS